MPRIFGQEIPTKTAVIGGGLMLAAVAVILVIRARSSPSAAIAPTVPEDTGYGYGGGGSVGVTAPTEQVASEYERQLAAADIEARSLANRYQSNLITQQEKQFAFQERQMEALAPDYLATERQALAAERAYQRTVEKIPVACPPGYARARSVTGELVCNPKGSGSKIVRAVESGAANVAKGAVETYGKRLTGQLPIPGGKSSPSSHGQGTFGTSWGYGF